MTNFHHLPDYSVIFEQVLSLCDYSSSRNYTGNCTWPTKLQIYPACDFSAGKSCKHGRATHCGCHMLRWNVVCCYSVRAGLSVRGKCMLRHADSDSSKSIHLLEGVFPPFPPSCSWRGLMLPVPGCRTSDQEEQVSTKHRSP